MNAGNKWEQFLSCLYVCSLSSLTGYLKKKKKIYNLIRSLENPLSVLNHNKAETRWGFLVVCPTTWIPAFLQPTEKNFEGKKYSNCACFGFWVFFFFPPTWFEANGLWNCKIFHMKFCFLTDGCSDPGSLSLRCSSVLNKSNLILVQAKPTLLTFHLVWLASKLGRVGVPQMDGACK